jgi:hypothetical protein
MASGDTVLTGTVRPNLSLSGTLLSGAGYCVGLVGHDSDGNVVAIETGGGDPGLFVQGVTSSPFDTAKQYDIVITEH